jgi:hypothetical protein
VGVSWTWRLEDGGGAELSEPVAPPHQNQADAETWLGERWRQLRDAGVVQVTLLDAGAPVYGPMPLTEE